eukprot:jgi/Psemu1/22944/gm1.22944_g
MEWAKGEAKVSKLTHYTLQGTKEWDGFLKFEWKQQQKIYLGFILAVTSLQENLTNGSMGVFKI